MTNKFIDGIDIHDAEMIYQTILRQHLYFIPPNELKTQVENVFNSGQVSAIIGAYWTSQGSGPIASSPIRYGMDKTEESGFTTLEDFLSTSVTNVLGNLTGKN